MRTDRRTLPRRIEGPGGLLLRRWAIEDADALGDAVAESIEHLRPWAMWAAHEPLTREARRQQILGWERAWDEAREFVLGILCGGRIVGGCGLHPETGTGALEIGYWVHADFTRRGVATRAACLLTDAALGLPEVAYVEIHHDKANLASSGVPRRLGYVLVGEGPDEPHAPGESGIECRWRMDRETWRRMRRDHSPADG